MRGGAKIAFKNREPAFNLLARGNIDSMLFHVPAELS